jgi:glycerophosphoryl diester phosphodiesterase
MAFAVLNAQIPKGFSVGKPIPYGHSHNDYIQMKPLWEALSYGFSSIEIDVYTAGDGTLHVSHIPFALLQKPTLEKLYLQPLKEWIDKNGGRVFPDTDVTLTLMIDLKGNGSLTYPILKNTLAPYREYITIYQQGKLVQKGPLRLMLSGNRPMNLLSADEEQFFCIDGSLGAEYSESKVNVGRESAPFGAYFNKKTSGKLSEKEITKLKDLVKKTTPKGHEIRFWAAGNNIKRWQALKDAGVTTINADKLKQFNQWIRQQ